MARQGKLAASEAELKEFETGLAQVTKKDTQTHVYIHTHSFHTCMAWLAWVGNQSH